MASEYLSKFSPGIILYQLHIINIYSGNFACEQIHFQVTMSFASNEIVVLLDPRLAEGSYDLYCIVLCG